MLLTYANICLVGGLLVGTHPTKKEKKEKGKKRKRKTPQINICGHPSCTTKAFKKSNMANPHLILIALILFNNFSYD